MLRLKRQTRCLRSCKTPSIPDLQFSPLVQALKSAKTLKARGTQTFRVDVLLAGLFGHGLFVFGGTFEQKLLGIKNAVLAEVPGHDRLGLIAQKIWFGANIHYFHAG